VLAATDPANPYGAALGWPSSPAPAKASEAREGAKTDGSLPQRAAGALVVLHDGALVGWLGRKGQTLLVFIGESEHHGRLASALAEALADLVDSGTRKVLWLTTIDGEDPTRSSVFPALLAAGFTRGARGLHKRRRVPGEREAFDRALPR
jgi:ATP-dependent Lhr-like helicase